MSKLPRLLFLIASAFAALLLVFQVESRMLYFPNQEGSYLTQDEHWINQTLDHFSPTVISFFLCLLLVYPISFSLFIVFTCIQEVEKYSIWDTEVLDMCFWYLDEMGTVGWTEWFRCKENFILLACKSMFHIELCLQVILWFTVYFWICVSFWFYVDTWPNASHDLSNPFL